MSHFILPLSLSVLEKEQLNFLWQLIKPLQLCTIIFLKLYSCKIVFKDIYLSTI